EGSRSEFGWGEMLGSAGIGAVLAPILVWAPELAIPLAGLGVAQGAQEMADGHYASGGYDIVMSLLPFAFKGARVGVFGEGSLPGGLRGYPVASVAARNARVAETGRALSALVSSLWNDRFYRGTTYYEALQAEQDNSL